MKFYDRECYRVSKEEISLYKISLVYCDTVEFKKYKYLNNVSKSDTTYLRQEK